MFENIKYSVVVLLNNDVWSVWELPGKPEAKEKFQIKSAIKQALIDSGADDSQVFTVQFSETIPADNVLELIAGLKESIENHVGYG